jgi:hypothetical protein
VSRNAEQSGEPEPPITRVLKSYFLAAARLPLALCGLLQGLMVAAAPEPNGVSGLGCEFILEAVAESQWAILRLLHVMAFQILLARQRYPGREMLSAYDRIPLKAPLVGDSKLTYLIVAPPAGVPASVQLESGRFEFYHLTAVTDSEAAYAREIGGPELLRTHSLAGFYPVIDPNRNELIPPKSLPIDE